MGIAPRSADCTTVAPSPCCRNLPKKYRQLHPKDVQDAPVEFYFGKEKGQCATAWHIKVLQVPGRAPALAFGGKLLCDYSTHVQGQIAEYKDSEGWGFLSVEIDFSSLPEDAPEYAALKKLPSKLFFHRSELPYQLCSCQRASDLCGAKVEFKVVVDDKKGPRAIRLCLLEDILPKHRRPEHHLRCATAQRKRD